MLTELVRRSPWGWRTAAVTSVSPDGWLHLACRDGQLSSAVHAWHHDDLVDALPVGTPVRLHQRVSALSGPAGLVSLHVAQAPPPVPEPVDLDTWAARDGAVVIDLRTWVPLPR